MDLPEQYLQSLLEISKEINSIQDPNVLLEQILRIAMQQLQAERGFILMQDSGSLEMRAAINFRDEDQKRPDKISQSAVDKVMAEGKPVLIYDAENQPESDPTQSMILNRIRSIIAAPLNLKGSLIGVIYIDSMKPAQRLNEASMKFVDALVNQAAIAIENARLIDQLKSENKHLKGELHRIFSFDEIIGRSPVMEPVFQLMGKVLNNDSTVLITGETGTGKELIARAIHYNGQRKEHPFVAVNCAAISENLIESELFGYKKGAFTGALKDKAGLIEEAQHGTLFLDEIGEIPLNVQVKLLRFLQSQEIIAVGDTKMHKTDVRIIAASNRDLLAEVKAKRFRVDLFYRLNIISLRLPPLRERRKDIPLLADYFVKKYAKRLGKQVETISKTAMDKLAGASWPGNVRELENTIERAVVLASGNQLQPDDIIITGQERPETIDSGMQVDELSRILLEKTLTATNGNKTRTAELMGVSLRWIHYKMKEWNIQ